MTMEQIILILVWVISISILLIFIPKDKIPDALVSFQFKQILTWLFGLLVVQMGLIKYPVRLFDYASKASFTFEFLAYPAVCAIFNVHYPEGKSKITQFGYYALYPSVMTVTEVTLENYTDVVEYINWSWYWTWITLITTLFLSHLYYKWFFKTINTGQHTK